MFYNQGWHSLIFAEMKSKIDWINALSCVAQWVGRHPVNQRVTVQLPGQVPSWDVSEATD